MVLITALLFCFFVTGIVYLLGSTMMDRQVIDERVKKFSRPGAGRSATQRTDILKAEFFAKKTNLRRLFEFKVAPNPQQVVVFLIVWGAVTFLIFSKLNLPPLSKVVLAALVSFVALRMLKIIAVRRRRAALERELPGTLDLIVICLEAGLGINAAFLRVSNEMENTPLGGELKQTFNEVSAGIPLDMALRNLAKRTETGDINAIVVSVIQAQKMGTAIATTFRVQSESLREKYKMKMKEKIMKVPIKILFPLVFFIFPTLFVVILGPAMISIVKQFGTGQ